MGSTETRNLWLSIMAGLFAAFMLYSYSQEKKAEYDQKYGSTKRVVIAKEDIADQQTIYDNMLETVERPSEFIEPDAVSIPDEVVGNVAAIPIRKGQQIVKNKLHTPGVDTGIASQVAPNKRAVTLPVDEVRGAAKLIRAGDHIDIMAAVDVGKGVNQHREVFLFMQDVPVLATGVSIANNIPRVFELDASGKNVNQITLSGDTKYSTITLEANIKEAQDLIYLLSTSPGNIFLLPRNPSDRNPVRQLSASTVENLNGRPQINADSAFNATPPAAAPITLPPMQQLAPTMNRVPATPAAPASGKKNGFRNL